MILAWASKGKRSHVPAGDHVPGQPLRWPNLPLEIVDDWLGVRRLLLLAPSQTFLQRADKLLG